MPGIGEIDVESLYVKVQVELEAFKENTTPFPDGQSYDDVLSYNCNFPVWCLFSVAVP